MKIKGEKDDFFCYHISRAPFCQGSNERLNIYCQIVIRALNCEKYHLIEMNSSGLNDEIKTEESPLGALNWQEQVAAINACLFAIFQPGHKAENFILEQALQVALENDIINALEFMDQDSESLISWSRVFAIIQEKDGLEIPTHEDIGFLIECMTWDDDFRLFALTPESIYETRQELKKFIDYPVEECIPQYDSIFWDQYEWDESQLQHLSEQLNYPTTFERKKDNPIKQIKEKPGEGFVYCIRECGGHLKIGKTTKTPQKRLKALQTSNPKILELCFAIRHKQYGSIETQIHEALRKYRVAGEWFNCEVEKVCQHFKNISDAEWIEGAYT